MLLSADEHNIILKTPMTLETLSIVEFPLPLFITASGRDKPE